MSFRKFLRCRFLWMMYYHSSYGQLSVRNGCIRQRQHHHSLRLLSTNLRLLSTNLRLLQYQPPTPQYQPPTPQYQPPTPQYQPPTPQYQPPTPQYQPPTPQYQPPQSSTHPSTPHSSITFLPSPVSQEVQCQNLPTVSNVVKVVNIPVTTTNESVSNTAKLGHIYLIATPEMKKCDMYKFGYHGADIGKLSRRYMTALPDHEILLFEVGTKEFEHYVKIRLSNHRVLNVNMNKSEKINLPTGRTETKDIGISSPFQRKPEKYRSCRRCRNRWR